MWDNHTQRIGKLHSRSFHVFMQTYAMGERGMERNKLRGGNDSFESSVARMGPEMKGTMNLLGNYFIRLRAELYNLSGGRD